MPLKTMAERVADAARHAQQERTGHDPQSVTVVFSEGTLVVTLHGALSPAEKAMSRSDEGAAQVREFHSQLFQNGLGPLSEEIQRITGVAVREAATEMVPSNGALVQLLSTGTMVQVFRLGEGLTAEAWNVKTGELPED